MFHSAPPNVTKYLVEDTVNIAASLNVTYKQWYPYFLKADQEEKPSKMVNDTTTFHYVKMVLTICKKDEEGKKIMEATPEKCTALPKDEIKGELKEYQYVKIIRTRTETPTKTTFYKGYVLPSLKDLVEVADSESKL